MLSFKKMVERLQDGEVEVAVRVGSDIEARYDEETGVSFHDTSDGTSYQMFKKDDFDGDWLSKEELLNRSFDTLVAVMWFSSGATRCLTKHHMSVKGLLEEASLADPEGKMMQISAWDPGYETLKVVHTHRPIQAPPKPQPSPPRKIRA